ncbi:T9SS type A sorting domain-containing protein [Foetidibacter luteolus]|uniref:T9SS type A sorting domain-containing protein n=1 Tax=Foetidibacter luteolus TaxID=2608880 RepID=UPI00129B1B65|nr:T9SS type A sorting domain-containing protein [Foetidibacter luteolus]
MLKEIALILLLGLLSCSALPGQSCNCGTGSNIGEMGYINEEAAFAGDQLVEPGDTLAIGSNGNVDIYGALLINGVLEMQDGAVLNIHGNTTVNGKLVLAQGAVINYYGLTWTNDAAAEVNSDLPPNGNPGNAVNFTTPQPQVPASWVTASDQVPMAPYSSNTQTQYIDGNYVPMNIDLHIQNTSNVQLTGSPTVIPGKISFDIDNAYLVTNDQFLILPATGNLAGYGKNRYVVTNNNNGELRKEGLDNGDSFFFPIGRSTADYSPANVEVNSGGPSVSYFANVRNYSESDPNENVGLLSSYPNVGRTWMIYSGNPGNQSTVMLIHNQATEANGYNHNNGNLVEWYDQGGTQAWAPNENGPEISGAYGTDADYWGYPGIYSIPSVKGSGAYFTKANTQRILPVKLTGFSAVPHACSMVISWSTSEELRNSHYEIEQSSNGRNFTALHKIASRNNPLGSQYSYTQPKVTAGSWYYRLKITDKDGNSYYSNVISAHSQCMAGNQQALTAYPNPIRKNETLKIAYLLPPGYKKAQLIMTDMPGKALLTKQVNGTGMETLTYTTINTDMLPAGTYFLRLISTGWASNTVKIVKY